MSSTRTNFVASFSMIFTLPLRPGAFCEAFSESAFFYLLAYWPGVKRPTDLLEVREKDSNLQLNRRLATLNYEKILRLSNKEPRRQENELLQVRLQNSKASTAQQIQRACRRWVEIQFAGTPEHVGGSEFRFCDRSSGL